MGDVGEGTGMDEGGLFFQCLEQIGHERILHQDGHCPSYAQVLSGDGVLLGIGADDDASNASAHVGEARGESQNRHNLTRHADIETALADRSIIQVSQTANDVTERAVIHVHHAVPGDAVGVNIELAQPNFLEIGFAPAALVVNARINRCRAEIVCGADRMNVAGQVQVEVLHRHNLAITAASCPTLDPKCRSHRRLAYGSNRFVAQGTQRLRQTNRRRGFALTKRCRRNRRHIDVFGVRALCQALTDIQMDFSLKLAVEFQVIFLKPHGARYFHNGFQDSSLCDFQIRRNRFDFDNRHRANLLRIVICNKLCQRWHEETFQNAPSWQGLILMPSLSVTKPICKRGIPKRSARSHS